MGKKRIVVGISGASGIPVAVDILKMLRLEEDVESHLVISDSARVTIQYESPWSVEYIEQLADCILYD